MTDNEMIEHKQRMLSFALSRIRKDAMREILSDLANGHPNPEGFLEWLEQKSDADFVRWWRDVPGEATVANLVIRSEGTL